MQTGTGTTRQCGERVRQVGHEPSCNDDAGGSELPHENSSLGSSPDRRDCQRLEEAWGAVEYPVKGGWRRAIVAPVEGHGRPILPMLVPCRLSRDTTSPSPKSRTPMGVLILSDAVDWSMAAEG